jgi:sugar lactone lactonase YvrE
VLAGGRTAPGQFDRPHGIAVDVRGNVYVAERHNHRIQVLSPTGEPLAQWGALGSGPGQFNQPSGVAIGGRGNAYVADTGNHRIQVLSPADGPEGRTISRRLPWAPADR